MRGSGTPVVLTINGRAELVVQDAASYQNLLDRVDELGTLEAIKRGIADVEAGRIIPLSQFKNSSARSMVYQVALTKSAKADADKIFEWVSERSPTRGPDGFKNSSILFIRSNDIRFDVHQRARPNRPSAKFFVCTLAGDDTYIECSSRSMSPRMPFGYFISATVPFATSDRKMSLTRYNLRA